MAICEGKNTPSLKTDILIGAYDARHNLSFVDAAVRQMELYYIADSVKKYVTSVGIGGSGCSEYKQ